MKQLEILEHLNHEIKQLKSSKLYATNQELANFADNFEVFYNNHYDYQQICDHLYDGIHIADGEGKVLYINEAYTRTTGIEPNEIVGRKVQDIEREGILYKGSVTDSVLKTKKRVNAVAKILKINKDVLITGTPIFDEHDNLQLVVCNTRDFSELKQMEERLSLMAKEQEKANEELAYLRHQQQGEGKLVFRSQAMQEVMQSIATVSKTNVNILITGESGTGKELVANEIYQQGARNTKPFIKVNCAAIPNELLESELFGYEQGAFTGARQKGKMGMFELADKGVILLDEIGDMPLQLQTKLLRVIQQREIVKIGSTNPIPLDIQIIASTNKDLSEEVQIGNFREDLFYRLNVFPIVLKPLKERKEDILQLTEIFSKRFGKKYGKSITITNDAKDVIVNYSWPGNIRELENTLERVIIISNSNIITKLNICATLNINESATNSQVDKTLKQQIEIFEKNIINETLEKTGSIRKAAKILGVDHSTLSKKLKNYKCCT